MSDIDDYSEADTRSKLIDPKLKEVPPFTFLWIFYVNSKPVKSWKSFLILVYSSTAVLCISFKFILKCVNIVEEDYRWKGSKEKTRKKI